jgi:hypothetical protein
MRQGTSARHHEYVNRSLTVIASPRKGARRPVSELLGSPWSLAMTVYVSHVFFMAGTSGPGRTDDPPTASRQADQSHRFRGSRDTRRRDALVGSELLLNERAEEDAEVAYRRDRWPSKRHKKRQQLLVSNPPTVSTSIIRVADLLFVTRRSSAIATAPRSPWRGIGSILGGLDVQADDVLELGANSGSVEPLKVLMRCGWRSWAPDALYRAQGDA